MTAVSQHYRQKASYFILPIFYLIWLRATELAEILTLLIYAKRGKVCIFQVVNYDLQAKISESLEFSICDIFASLFSVSCILGSF